MFEVGVFVSIPKYSSTVSSGSGSEQNVRIEHLPLLQRTGPGTVDQVLKAKIKFMVSLLARRSRAVGRH